MRGAPRKPGGFRLAAGGRVDRGRPLICTWNGRPLRAFAGDTLASALLANGVRVVGRSFKFHRPRGVLSAGVEEPNALVTLGVGARIEPSARATLVRVHEGLVARAQNCWPSVDHDLGRVLDLFAPLWPAGFYNKTFIRPSWHFYEGFVRRTAGLGPAPRAPDPDRYEHTNAHCDLLIVGGGPAGLAAAQTAVRAGARVILVEQDADLGGHLLGERTSIDGVNGAAWAAAVGEALRARGMTVLTSTMAFGVYDHGCAGLVQRVAEGTAPRESYRRERYWRVRARATLLATGAIEQPLVFERNDRPGIMLAGAVRCYANRYGVAAGSRVAIATNNDTSYATAFDLLEAGVGVAAVIDSRCEPPADHAEALRRRGVTLLAGATPLRSLGRPDLRAIEVEDDSGRMRRIDCDVLAMSAGWSPTVHLFSHARGRLEHDAARGAFLPVRGTAPVAVAGGVAGTYNVRTALEDAQQSAAVTLEQLGFARPAAASIVPSVVELEIGPTHGSARPSARARARRSWVDFQHDVTLADLELGVREGFEAIEHLKRYTTTGMAVDQGKTSNLNALRIAGDLTGRPPGKVGTTTFRPPYSPVTLGALAGRYIGERYAPRRLLPTDAEQRAFGALFEEAGGWMRPACYPRAGETRAQAIHREVLAVRDGAGLFDASPLGKIEVMGADAAWFLDRFYLNNVMTLEPGRLRYGIMLNENGIVIDDGTIARLAPKHFLITTTSGGASRIAGWLEEWRQCEWPDRDVIVTPVTTQWATLALSGPHAREVLSRLPADIDLAREAFPHLQIRCGSLAGAPARIYRVSFSGELSYEVNVPARCGAALWRALMEAGRDAGIAPYGIESLLVLRLEKGFLHVGADTDGTTNPADIGWGEVALKKKADYIGKRSLGRADNLRQDRLQLVGLTSSDADALVPGAHLRLSGTAEGSDGWVTSAAVSPTLGRPIALAMLRSGHARLGERVTLHAEERTGLAEVVPMSFYDPENQRVNA